MLYVREVRLLRLSYHLVLLIFIFFIALFLNIFTEFKNIKILWENICFIYNMGFFRLITHHMIIFTRFILPINRFLKLCFRNSIRLAYLTLWLFRFNLFYLLSVIWLWLFLTCSFCYITNDRYEIVHIYGYVSILIRPVLNYFSINQ